MYPPMATPKAAAPAASSAQPRQFHARPVGRALTVAVCRVDDTRARYPATAAEDPDYPGRDAPKQDFLGQAAARTVLAEDGGLGAGSAAPVANAFLRNL